MSEKDTKDQLRIVIADDERPARAFLAGVLRGFADAEIVGVEDLLRRPLIEAGRAG